MKKKTLIVPLALMFCMPAYGADHETDLARNRLDQIVEQLQMVQQQLQQVLVEQSRQKKENGELKSQLAAIQGKNAKPLTTVASNSTREDYETVLSDSSSNVEFVDLRPHEQASIQSETSYHVLSNPWFQNLDITGFGSIGYYDTGSAGSREHGSFEVKESSLFIEGSVWENISYFLEFQINRLGIDARDAAANTGEAYLHVRDIPLGRQQLGLKVGRIDLPFGEEYLWQDAIDNPLITSSAMYAYGWDEGLLLYSQWRGVNWIAAVTDGTNQRSRDKNSEKAINLKIYGNPTEPLYLSASYMHSGDTPESAIAFGGAHPMPVGEDLGSRDSFTSSLGDSSSEEIGTDLLEIDGRYDFSLGGRDAYVALTLGAARVDDSDSAFDRDFIWFSVEPYLQINRHWYTVLRYSEIGTYDDNQGYLFGGKIFAKGLVSAGYDAKRLRRLGIGIGWMPNPRLRAKFEVGKDWLDVIDGSPIIINDNRNFVGFEAAVGF